MGEKFNEVVDSLKAYVDGEKLSGEQEICFSPAKEKRTPSTREGLAPLRGKVSACEKCSLAGTRTNVVFGEGNPNAELMFIGEAPGADEDKQGKPFVGRAGKLLTKIIESIGLTREDVYIANILKCRPPGNRNPLPDEITACSPYLVKQIEEIKPRVICALGRCAAQRLLASEVTIGNLRGKFHNYLGVKLMPTYHPAYLLRNSSGKKDVWDDMKTIAKELGLKISRKGMG
jgi:uracil-DNA glycosylase